MAATRTTVDAVLKEDIQPGLREQLNNAHKFGMQWEKNEKDVYGRYARLALHTGRSSAVGGRLEGQALPASDRQRVANEQVPLISCVLARYEITGETFASMDRDQGAFLTALELEANRLSNDAQDDWDRQCWGTSNGVLATCGTTGASTTLQLASTTTAVQMRAFFVGMRIDVGTVANPTLRTSNNVITAIDTTNLTLTVTTALTTASTDFVFREGAGGAAGGVGQKEVTGVTTIVAATGALHNVDPATVPIWASTVDSNSGTNRAVSEELVEKALQNVEIASGQEINQLWSSNGVHRRMAALMQSQKRFNNTMDMKGGYQGLEFTAGGRSVAATWEKYAPNNKIWGFNTKHLINFRNPQGDWKFQDRDGSVLHYVAGYNSWEAFLWLYCENATDQRNAHFLISDVSEAA